MAKKVFLSFHYDGDVIRCQRVRNIGAIEADREEVSAQKWETIKAGGDQAIKNWIAKEMTGKDAVVVLVGGKTASRPWVKYEIEKAWKDKVPLVGIRIHGMLDFDRKPGTYGDDPFSKGVRH
jgi:dissimilatory sulfite reductase (desulfoviridin) alpha/beta subunit